MEHLTHAGYAEMMLHDRCVHPAARADMKRLRDMFCSLFSFCFIGEMCMLDYYIVL